MPRFETSFHILYYFEKKLGSFAQPIVSGLRVSSSCCSSVVVSRLDVLLLPCCGCQLLTHNRPLRVTAAVAPHPSPHSLAPPATSRTPRIDLLFRPRACAQQCWAGRRPLDDCHLRSTSLPRPVFSLAQLFNLRAPRLLPPFGPPLFHRLDTFLMWLPPWPAVAGRGARRRPRRRRQWRLTTLVAMVSVGVFAAAMGVAPCHAQVADGDDAAVVAATPGGDTGQAAAPPTDAAATAAAATSLPDDGAAVPVATTSLPSDATAAPVAATPEAFSSGAATPVPAALPPVAADPVAALRSSYALSIVDDAGLERFSGTSVVVKGTSEGVWGSCSPTNVSVATCFVEEVYQSQLSFVFSYNTSLAAAAAEAAGAGEGALALPSPTVTATGGDAQPAVQHYTVDVASGKGSFTVVYSCTGGHDTLSVMQLVVPLGGEGSAGDLSITWGKVCSGGPHRYLEWGVVAGESVVPFASAAGAAYTSTPLEQTTVLSLGLRPPAETLAFGYPIVNSSDPSVQVAVRGVSKSGGILAIDQRVTITLLYTCAGRANSTIGVSVPIPPWDPLTASWEKDCGGGAPTGLSVGTSSGTADVVAGGMTTPAFDQASAVRLAAAGRYTVSANASTSTFYLENTAAPSLPALHLDGIALTVTNPAVVRVSVLGGSGFLDGRGGAELGGGQTRKLKLRYVCLSRGVAAVVVTVPTLRYANVEWGVVKACESGPVRRVGWSWRSISGVEDAIAVVLAVAVLGGVCLFQRRRRRAAAAGGGAAVSAVSPRIKYQLAADDEEGLPQ